MALTSPPIAPEVEVMEKQKWNVTVLIPHDIEIEAGNPLEVEYAVAELSKVFRTKLEIARIELDKRAIV